MQLRKEVEQTYKVANGYKKELNKLKVDIIGGEKEKVCVNCHNPFYPKINNMDSCQYHPGPIKFYSCKYFFEIA